MGLASVCAFLKMLRRVQPSGFRSAVLGRDAFESIRVLA